jgi:hypothetical protein
MQPRRAKRRREDNARATLVVGLLPGATNEATRYGSGVAKAPATYAPYSTGPWRFRQLPNSQVP